ncbi:MAG: sigma-70 family RNA polymerase sigma factor [Heyndrickxia sp.]
MDRFSMLSSVHFDESKSTVDSLENTLLSLMNKHGDDLMKLAFSYINSTETAKDIVQTTFIKAFTNIDKFKGKSSYKTWLYRITVNLCKDYLKSAVYKRTIFSEKFQELQSSSESLEEKILKDERASELRTAVFSLPIKYREVIIMYYFQELSVEEISNVLKMSKNTIRTRLQRAKKKLAFMMKEEVVFYER